MKRLLKYLTWLGDSAQAKDEVLELIDRAATAGLVEAETGIESYTKQLYLKSAEGEYLDRWGWELVRLRRKWQEDDESYRGRILQELFREYATRKSARETVRAMTGRLPIEIIEPIRDTAYIGAGMFLTAKTGADIAAADDCSGQYIARFGTKEDTSFIGIVRVRLTETQGIGAGLFFYNADFMDASFLTPISRKQTTSRAELLNAVRHTIPAGTNVFVEFVD